MTVAPPACHHSCRGPSGKDLLCSYHGPCFYFLYTFVLASSRWRNTRRFVPKLLAGAGKQPHWDIGGARGAVWAAWWGSQLKLGC